MALADNQTQTKANPLNTNLLMYYLSGLAGPVAQGGNWQGALGGMVGQSIAAQNYASIADKQMQNYSKLLQQLLGGLPDGASIKGNASKLTVDMPISALGTGTQQGTRSGEIGGMISPEWTSLPSTGAINPTQGSRFPTASPAPDMMTPGLVNRANPFFTSPLAGANLAGLTPEMIHSALQTQLGYEALGQRQIESLMDYYAKMQPAGVKPEDQPFPVPFMGRQLTVREWNALPNESKKTAIDDFAYESYVAQSKELNPDEPVIPKGEFVTRYDVETKMAYLRGLERYPNLMKIAKELEESKATKINMMGKEEVKDVAGRINYLKSAQFIKDIDKFKSDTYAPDATPEAWEDIIHDRVADLIKASGGNIVKFGIENGTGVWDVVWTYQDETGKTVSKKDTVKVSLKGPEGL